MHLDSLQLQVGRARRRILAPPRASSRQRGLNGHVCGQAFKTETDACARAHADRMRVHPCPLRETFDRQMSKSQNESFYFTMVSGHTHIPAHAYCDGRQQHRLQSAAQCAPCLPSPDTCRPPPSLISEARNRVAHRARREPSNIAHADAQ